MNTMGRLFRVGIYGESHGECVGVVLDGCPAGIPISADEFAADMERRRGGKPGTTPRAEADIPKIRSGVFNGTTTGAPINIVLPNRDVDSSVYDDIKDTPRPGHADFTGKIKHGGFNDHRGGGHFSGRLTAGLVATGIIAKKILDPAQVSARLIEAGGTDDPTGAAVAAGESGDSIGGIVECTVDNVPTGLGEPFFDSVESLLARGIFAIPGIKGVEFGAGFRCARMRGSDFNDDILNAKGTTETNNCGGINGGITNGNRLVLRAAVRPTASIAAKQRTVNMSTGQKQEIEIKGRHDACIALRVPVVLEAMVAIVMADLMMTHLGLGAATRAREEA